MKIKSISLLALLATTSVWAQTSNWNLKQSATTEIFNGIAAPNNDFAIGVGENATIVHFVAGDNGTVIETADDTLTKELYDVYATSENMALAVGEEIVLMWDGSTWETILETDNGAIFTGTWISPEEDILWFGVQNGSGFGTVCPHEPGAAQQPFCRAFSNAFMLTACGESDDAKLLLNSGDIYNFNNTLGETNDTTGPVHDQTPNLALTAIFVPDDACLPGPIAPQKLFAIQNGNDFWHFDGSTWSDMNVNVPSGQTLTWLDGTSSSRVVAVGHEPDGNGGNKGVVWIYENNTWTQDTNLPPGTPGLTDVIANISFINTVFESGFENTPAPLPNSFTSASINQPDAGIDIDFLVSAEEGYILHNTDLFDFSLVDVLVETTRITGGPYKNGDTVNYQLVVQNLGPNPALDFRFMSMANPALDHVSDTCDFTEFGVFGNWEYYETRIPELQANKVLLCNVEMKVNGNVGDRIVHRATVSEVNDTNWVNNDHESEGVSISPP